MKKKKKKEKKKNELTAATRLTFMSGKTQCARVQEKERPPSVCKREGVPVHL